MAIDSGTRFWDNVSREPFEQLQAPAETRTLLQEGMFFEPFRSLERVVFIATPHRGSFRAAWSPSSRPSRRPRSSRNLE